MKNLFIVRSPLQIINAIEAVHNFNLTDNTLVLIHNRSITNTEQMKDLLNLIKWEEIIHVEESYGSKFFKYISLIKQLKKERYNYLFIGELGVSYKMIVANTKKEKVFLIDDGTATIMYYDRFIKHDRYNKYNFREIRFLFFGLNIKVKDKINLFTYFDLKPVHGNEVVKNRLIYFRSTYLFNIKKEKDVIYFIGQPADVFMDIDLYKESIEKLMIKYNKKIIYIPHRSEKKEQVQAIMSMKNQNFEIYKPAMPIELYFLYSKLYPLYIISYYSTALVTLNMLFEESRIEYIKVAKNSINEERFAMIENTYKFLDESGIHQLYI